MAVSRGVRIGVVALFAALAVTVGVLLFGGSASDADYRPPETDQTRLVLRLHDLPPGYGNAYLGEGMGDDSLICESFSRRPDKPGAVAAFAREYRPHGCIAGYVSRFTIPGEEPGPPVVFSGAMTLGSAAAAADAWKLVPAMFGLMLPGGPPPEVDTSIRIGVQTRLFHTSRASFPYQVRGKQKASFLAWRSGNTLATVVALGGSTAVNDRAVAELAPRQQEHIREPTPYTTAERFDGEVGLDDPAIDIPVFWLGRTFRPGGSLLPNQLFRSGYGEPVPEEKADGFKLAPQPPLAVEYQTIRLDTWTPESWPVFIRSASAKAITRWKCTRTRTVAIPGGNAKIFGGYKEDFARCPKEPPRAFTAWVDVAGVKVVVNSHPAPDFIETGNPYGSFKGMRAIVTALRERPKPLY